jgi:gliding motility-associated-like protein
MKHISLRHSFLPLIVLFLLIGQLQAQNTLVYTEDFENGPGSFGLNTSNEVGVNTGPNQWVVNDLYTGTPLYPNTISQDSTVGGLINFAPFSKYLHIEDSVAAVTQNIGNANFNPSQASDRFTSTESFCTLGLDSVRIAFFYTCEGNPGASAQLFYQADGGTWTAVPGAIFNSQQKWRYVEFYDEGFDNKNNLRFGFQWINDGTGATAGSMGIDGVRIVGKYAPEVYGVSFQLQSISPNPVCRGDAVLLSFSNPVPLCGTGFYEVQFSNEFADFTNYTSIGIFQLNNQNTTQFVFSLPTPSNLNPSVCYKLRVMRVDITPVIVSDTSICIEVQNCPNQIITLQPPVISNPLDTICVGSVIDVPFYSLGVFLNNTYVAQLSDSNGFFPQNPNVLGYINDNTTYPPGSMPKGNVPGLVRPVQQPIPPGCNYYIRVISSSPSTTGSVYGPFCIRNCDIETNQKQDVKFCIDDVNGGDTLLTVNIGVDPPVATYTPPNEFQIQLLDFQSFGVLSTGTVGTVAAVNDTLVQLSIPNLPNLFTVGLIPGNYYMRIVATNSDQSWDQLGTLVRLTIGAPNPSPLSIGLIDINTFMNVPFDGDSTICANTGMWFMLSPFNFSSSYVWSLNADPDFFEGGPYNGILFNGVGQYTIGVTETNFGCVGPGSVPAQVTVLGPPSATIVGPFQACIGDTVTYTVPLNEDTYYSWSVNPGMIVDSLSNTANISFPVNGTTVISMEAVNLCGTQNSSKNVQVRLPPVLEVSNDTTICASETVSISTPDVASYTFHWLENGQQISQENAINVQPDTTTSYVIRATNYGGLACESLDTVTVYVQQPDTGNVVMLNICEGETAQLQSDSTGLSYLWTTAAISQSIAVSDSGWYSVLIIQAGEVCPLIDSFHVNVSVCYQPLELPNAFSPNGDGMNDAFKAKSTYTYDEFSIEIFNRWGLKVYESVNPYFEWNGMDLSGNQLPNGTYFYIAKLSHHENSDLQKGTVTLLGN